MGHSENSMYASHDDCCILAKHSPIFIEMDQFPTYAYKFLKSSAAEKLKWQNISQLVELILKTLKLNKNKYIIKKKKKALNHICQPIKYKHKYHTV